jgi:hypothetical protein
VIPEVAFDPDISGVCKVGGTLVMISKPTKIASMKIVKSVTRSPIVVILLLSGGNGF